VTPVLDDSLAFYIYAFLAFYIYAFLAFHIYEFLAFYIHAWHMHLCLCFFILP
jgi:hypothetical protein